MRTDVTYFITDPLRASALSKVLYRPNSTPWYTDSTRSTSSRWPPNSSLDARYRNVSLTTLNTTTEKRLLIDLAMLRESYEKREIADVYWIPDGQNPADALSKNGTCEALVKLLKTNKVGIKPTACIEKCFL